MADHLLRAQSLTRDLLEVFDLLEIFVSNVEILGPAFCEEMLGLSEDDQKW